MIVPTLAEGLLWLRLIARIASVLKVKLSIVCSDFCAAHFNSDISLKIFVNRYYSYTFGKWALFSCLHPNDYLGTWYDSIIYKDHHFPDCEHIKQLFKLHSFVPMERHQLHCVSGLFLLREFHVYCLPIHSQNICDLIFFKYSNPSEL